MDKQQIPFKRYAIAHNVFELLVWLSYRSANQVEFLIEDIKETTASDGDGDYEAVEIFADALRRMHKTYNQGDK